MAKIVERVADYIDGSDLSRRFHQTIIRYQNKPVIASVLDRENVILQDAITDRDLGTHSIHEPDINIHTPQLGYAWSGETAVYVMRHAYRNSVQGLHPGVNVLFLFEYAKGGDEPQHHSSGYKLTAKAILGEFEYIRECSARLRAGKKRLDSVPFDRKFALVRTNDPGVHQIAWCGRRVGLYDPDANTGVLMEGFQGTSIPSRLMKYMNVVIPETGNEGT